MNKKNIIIICVVFLLLLIGIIYFLDNYKKTKLKTNEYNNQFNIYLNKEISASDLTSLINKVIDLNEKNNIQKDDKKLYIENEENSIKIDIEFLPITGEKDEQLVFPMERLNEKGLNEFRELYENNEYVNFRFKAIEIDYHNKSKKLKYIKFKEIENINKSENENKTETNNK